MILRRKDSLSGADTRTTRESGLSVTPTPHALAHGNKELALIRMFPGTLKGFPVQSLLCPVAEIMWVVLTMHLGATATSTALQLPPGHRAPRPLTSLKSPSPIRADYHDLHSCSGHLSLLTATIQPDAATSKLAGPYPSSRSGL